MVSNKNIRNILFVECGRSGYGGSFHNLYLTIKNLSQRKYKFDIVFFNKSVFYERLSKTGTECHYIDDVIFSDGRMWQKYILGKLNGFMLRYLPLFSVWFEYIIHRGTISKLTMLTRRKNIDLIHLNNQVVLNFMGVFVAKFLSIPCVSHLRTFNSYGLNGSKISYAKKIMINYIAVSERIKGHWVEKGLDPKKVETIYNACQSVDNDVLCVNDVSVMSEYDGYKIIYVGRFTDCKGIPFLIESFSRALESNINAKLFLVGDGVEMGKIRTNVSLLNIESHVIFMGYQESPRNFISIADLLVLPSKEEGFGRVLLEAMEAGTPVIGTNIGGIPEIIEHELNGLLVSFGDVEQLKESMIRILTDDGFREKIICEGFRTINAKFSTNLYKNKMEKLYDSIMN